MRGRRNGHYGRGHGRDRVIPTACEAESDRRAAAIGVQSLDERAGLPPVAVGASGRSGAIYFVTTVTRHRVPYFSAFEPARAVARIGGATGTWPQAALLAWVLMPDHWHGLIGLGDGASLSACIARFKGEAARAANRSLQRSGALWMPGFHDHAIRNARDVRRAARYLVANPLRAGLVTEIGSYPYWNAAWL